MYNLIYLAIISLLIIISLINLFYAKNLSNLYNGYFKKQLLWIIICSLILIVFKFIKKPITFKLSYIIYFINIIFLIIVLFSKEVNGAKAWIKIGSFSFQPSEFMKISLCLALSSVIYNNSCNTFKENLILIFKIFLLFFLPTFLTFIEPDTGAVIMYFIITIVSFLLSKIKKKYKLIILTSTFLIIGALAILFYLKPNTFTSIFGSSIYYRLERIMDFKNKRGMQIENALITLSNTPFITTPSKAVNLYFPEAATDFIFSLCINNFGLIMILIIIALFLLIDLVLINNFKFFNYYQKLIIIPLFFMFLFQQIYNIYMNIALVPIMGITLPFISYGGSSMVLYTLFLSLILKFNNSSDNKDI